MKNLVIISLWTEGSIQPLLNLLKQITIIEAGVDFELAIVCNTNNSNQEKFLLNLESKKIKILIRENTGFNIGAWDYGWRNLPPSDNYLFLQDDCYILRRGWLKAFVDKFEQDSNMGLLGESLNWNFLWEKAPPSKKEDAILYRNFLAKNQIPEGDTARHLQSLILFTSRSILEQINGFIIADTYREAIASEIAISQKVEALNYEINQVKPNHPFYYICHPQWKNRRRKMDRLTNFIANPYYPFLIENIKKIF